MTGGAEKGRSDLAVLWDVIVAPSAAFDAIAQRPAWLWAFVVTSALAIAASLLQLPATQHVIAASTAEAFGRDPRLASMTPAQQANLIAMQSSIVRFGALVAPFYILGAALVTALMLTLGKAIGNGRGAFGTFFALATNVALLYWGLGFLFVAAVVAIRGPQNYSSAVDVLRAWPSLAWIVPGAPAKLAAFLAGLNVFALWSCALLALGLRRISGVTTAVAWFPALALLLLTAALGTAGAS